MTTHTDRSGPAAVPGAEPGREETRAAVTRVLCELLGRPSKQEVRIMKALRAGEPLSAFRSIISAIASSRGYTAAWR